jgi:hypothetical protein
MNEPGFCVSDPSTFPSTNLQASRTVGGSDPKSDAVNLMGDGSSLLLDLSEYILQF